MTVPYTFATATGNVPLAELDANFASVSNNVSDANGYPADFPGYDATNKQCINIKQ